MKAFLHRILFVILIIPIGILLIIETPLHLIAQSIRWIIFGEFNDEFIFDMITSKILDRFEKVLSPQNK